MINNLCETATDPHLLPLLGGAFENADFSADWWKVFEQSKITKERLFEVTRRVNGNRPEVVTKSITVHDYVEMRPEAEGTLLPQDIALRIAAIRETFEETGRFIQTSNLLEKTFRKTIRLYRNEQPQFTPNPLSPFPGVLLLANNDNDNLVPLSDQDDVKINLSNWREKVRNDPTAFVQLCLKLNQCPDIWSLYEWSNWLTPISVGHKRFDTIFYVCCLENIPKVIIDNREVTNLKVGSLLVVKLIIWTLSSKQST